MNNKLRSLLYLSCFMIVSVIYQTNANEDISEKQNDKKEIVQVDATIKPFTKNLEK